MSDKKKALLLTGRDYGKFNAFIERLKREGIKVVEIQQSPKVDVAYIEKKAVEIYNLQWDKKGIDSPFHQVKGIIIQIISDTRGQKP